MPNKTPGVYVEEISLFPSSIAQVETAIPAFIGHTEKAIRHKVGDLHLKPTRIGSFAEFQLYFGEGYPEEFELTVDSSGEVQIDSRPESPSYYMYYALKMYFGNGGGECIIVSIGNYEDVVLLGTNDQEGYRAGLHALSKEDNPTIIVSPDAQLLDNNDFHALYRLTLEQCNTLQDRFAIFDVKKGTSEPDEPGVIDGTGGFREMIGINHLRFGAAYYPNLQTILNYTYNSASVKVKLPNGKQAPLKGLKMTSGQSSVKLAKLAIENIPVVMPPSSIVAGVYCQTDRDRGVWSAPANVSLNLVEKPVVAINAQQQESLNVDVDAGKSVNAIRSFTGRGVLIWGARTLAGNDNEWRYVNVRRFFIFAEESIKKGTEAFVFEPNDADTWARIKTAISNFLLELWREGALSGATPDEAFFVKVGLNETMTSVDVLEGRLIIEVGMAVVRPAEFIILRFVHKLPES